MLSLVRVTLLKVISEVSFISRMCHNFMAMHARDFFNVDPPVIIRQLPKMRPYITLFPLIEDGLTVHVSVLGSGSSAIR